MESTENASSETRETELKSELEDKGTPSSVMETQEDEELQAHASEICLTMPVWDDNAPDSLLQADDEYDERFLIGEDDEKRLLGDDTEDAQVVDLAQKEIENTDAGLNVAMDDVLITATPSKVHDLVTKVEDSEQIEAKDDAKSKDLEQEADFNEGLAKEEVEHIQNETSDIEKEESVADLVAEVRVKQELVADVNMADMSDDSDVEVLRDDIANIRKLQETPKSSVAVKKREMSTNETEPEMMVLDDVSDEDNMYDLEVLDSWEEGADEEGAELDDEVVKEGEIEKEELRKDAKSLKDDEGENEELRKDGEGEKEESRDGEGEKEEIRKDGEGEKEELRTDGEGERQELSKGDERQKEDLRKDGDGVELISDDEVNDGHEKDGDGVELVSDDEERDGGEKNDEECIKESEVCMNESTKTVADAVEIVNIVDVEDETPNLDMKVMYENLFRLKEQELNNFDIAETASKAEITRLTESNNKQTAKIVTLEREVTELRSLVEKMEKQGGEDSKEALLVMLSKKKLEVDKLNDTIEEIEENLQKVFAEKLSLDQKVEDLEKQIRDSGCGATGDNKSTGEKWSANNAELIQLKDELQDALENVKLLENELKSSHAKEDMIIEKQLDYEERISILEIDLEYAKAKREQESEANLNEIQSLEKKLSQAEEQLGKEKKTNEELRNNLKEEMKVRIRELKDSMANEMFTLKSEVGSLKASELEALRKLEDHRSKMDVMTKQNRQLKADLKSKAMEVDAYANIAQQLKTHILNLEKANKDGDDVKKPNVDPKEKKPVLEKKNDKEESEEEEEEGGEEEESGSPEIITIDTDDQESNGEDNGIDENATTDSVKSATKRQLSPAASKDSGKKLKLSVGNSSINNVTPSDVSAKLDNNEAESNDGMNQEKDGKLVKGDQDTAIVQSESVHESSTLDKTQYEDICAELKEVRRILAEKEAELAALALSVVAKCEAHIILESEISRLQAELSGMIDTRDKLEPQLVSLTEELNNEKSRVEMLASQLHERTVTAECVLSEQQVRLETLQLRLKALESELSERDMAIKNLQEEVSCLAEDKVALTDSNEKLEKDGARHKDDVAVSEHERLKLTEVTEKLDRVSDELNSILVEREQLVARIAILEAADEGLKVLTAKNEALQAELSVAVDEQERQKRLVLELTQGASRAEELQLMVDNLKLDVEEAQTKRFELINEMTRRQREVEGERDSLQRLVAEQQNFMKESDRERKLAIEMTEATNKTLENLRKEVAEVVLNAEQLQQDMDRLRQHAENVETQLANKEETIQQLKAKVQELNIQQKDKRIEADKMKQKLEETQRDLTKALNNTYSLTTTVEQLYSEVTEKTMLKLKLVALENELADVLHGRSEVNTKLQELWRDAIKQDEYSVKVKDIHEAVEQMMSTVEEMKTRISQLNELGFPKQTDAEETAEGLTAVPVSADVETIRDDLGEIKVNREDLQKKLVELEQHNMRLSKRLNILGSKLRANSEGELENTASKTSLVTNKITEELITLQKDMKRLTASEALLNRSVSELQKEVITDGSLGCVKSDATLVIANDQLSELTALVTEMKKKCEEMDGLLGASNKREAALKESLGASEQTIEELKTLVKNVKCNNESLQSRLQLSLTNGRRMETILQKLQKSALSYKENSDGSEHLQFVQKERDDLLKKLEDAEDSKKRLKAKVITLAMILKCKQNSHQNISGQSVDLGDWEQAFNEVTVLNTSTLSELTDSIKIESSPRSVLKTSTEFNRHDENDNCGPKRGLGSETASSSKKMRTQAMSDSKVNTKKGLALNTITNSTSHSLVVSAQDTNSKSQSTADNQDKCKVQ